jgi:endonuclease YncB( thermonuclease family)
MLALVLLSLLIVVLGFTSDKITSEDFANYFQIRNRPSQITEEHLPYISQIHDYTPRIIEEMRKRLPIRTAAELLDVPGIGERRSFILRALFDLSPDIQVQTPPAKLVEAQVIEVIDGDSIRVLLNGTRQEVRYIGVDTPQLDKECYAQKALEHNEYLIGISDKVWLERDVEDKDKRGRLLRYVYLDPEGDFMVNEILLSQGDGILMTIPPNYKHRRSFKRLAEKAWWEGKGIWSACRVEEVLTAAQVEENFEQYKGKIVTVQYKVAHIGIYKGIVFLNSSLDRGHFTAVIFPDDIAADFPESGIDISSLEWKVIQVRGKLELYKGEGYGQPQIVVEAPWQIEVKSIS